MNASGIRDTACVLRVNPTTVKQELKKQHTVGKPRTQKIERKHLNLRPRIKRLVRRTLCFSKMTARHELVIGLFGSRYECRLAL
jgi:insertion element IS1 protein InsB